MIKNEEGMFHVNGASLRLFHMSGRMSGYYYHLPLICA